MFGTSSAAKEILALAENLEEEDRFKVGMIPLYIINYIWDGDELSDEDLELSGMETAKYSCHVVGLVLDATRRVCIVADPNGGLVPGGSMEFLSIPLHTRATPSTSVSQFDLDDSTFHKQERVKMARRKCFAHMWWRKCLLDAEFQPSEQRLVIHMNVGYRSLYTSEYVPAAQVEGLKMPYKTWRGTMLDAVEQLREVLPGANENLKVYIQRRPPNKKNCVPDIPSVPDIPNPLSVTHGCDTSQC